MTAAAQTLKGEEDKTYRDKAGENKKRKKQGTNARNPTEGVHSTKSSRLC